MTTRRGLVRSVVGSAVFLIGLWCVVWPIGLIEAGTAANLAWDANSEPDLAGYRIHAGTSSGSYTLPTLDVGKVTSYSISNLQANTTYYVVVTAYDYAGNESASSNEIAVQASVVTTLPTIDQVLEAGTGTIYLLQAGDQIIEVSGTNFQRGAVAGLGAGISVGPTSPIDAGHLNAPVNVGATAPLGPRTLTVTNPDSGAAGKANALTVVKTADINRDCKIDLFDLNLIARAWNTLSTESAYVAAADLDGDGEVGGLDLDILVSYFGQPLTVCP